MHRANIVDDMNAMKYFKRCLNANIVAAIGGKYFRSMQDLLSYAIREEKKVIKVQQGKITWCIDLCQDKCAKKQPNMSSVVGDKKQSSTPYKNRKPTWQSFSVARGCASPAESERGVGTPLTCMLQFYLLLLDL